MKRIKNSLLKSGRGLVVIIGCDSGIGKALAERMAHRGYLLAVSYLHENHFENHRQVFARKMNLENPDEVAGFCEAVKQYRGPDIPLAALVYNAGVALGGPVENLPMDLYRRSFEINFFGAVTMVQALIPDLIKNKGTICVIGSMAGRIAMPFLSPYAASKFALEGFCDSLRREMNPSGVKTILIEPAAVATSIWNNAKKQDISFVDEKYKASLLAFQDNFIESGNKGMPVERAADRIIRILEKNKPRARYIIARNPMLFRILPHLPSILLDKAVIRMFKMNYGGF